jgi:hypothetical protein
MKTIIENPDGSVTIDGVTYVAQIPSVTPETPKPKPPERWEELGRVGGTWIGTGSTLNKSSDVATVIGHANMFASEAYAKSSLAFAQLSQLYEAWKRIEFPDWKADWNDKLKRVFVPEFCDGMLKPGLWWSRVSPFPFPTAELCQKFIDCPEIASLLRTFYMIEE